MFHIVHSRSRNNTLRFADLTNGEIEMFTEELKNSIQYYRADDPPNSLSKKFWDEMQPALRCCGAEGWKDWERAGHLKRGHKVPASCCDSELGTCSYHHRLIII